jgi:hypothetical protein
MAAFAPLIRKPAMVAPSAGAKAAHVPKRKEPPAAPMTRQLFAAAPFQHPVEPLDGGAVAIARAKLEINRVDDPLERRADEMAAKVMTAPAPRAERPRALAAPRANQPTVAREMTGTMGRPLEAPVRHEFEQRFGHDFSLVRVHTDARAAQSAQALDALAYTIGQDIVFARDSYAPRTPQGQKLLAHELAHTIQFENGAEGRLQRRVPSAAGLGADLPADPAGLLHARTGLSRVLSRIWAELTPPQQAAVRTAATGFGIAWVAEADLRSRLDSATRAQLLSFANAVRTAAPAAQLGDPLLIDSGARPGTSDAANITTLVGRADSVFATIAGGARDADLTQIFGAANVAAAKAKYALARTQMNHLKVIDKIVTDRSGYNAEVGLGGLSNAAQISVEPSTVDNPTVDESIVTLIHESMHAGNIDIRDFGYIDQPSFRSLDAAVKLVNAAHFEVVPRRILTAAHSFPGETFIPAGTSVGGVAAPALTRREQAIRNASETFRLAWTAGLNLHKLFVRLFRNPGEWSTLDLATVFTGAAAGSPLRGYAAVLVEGRSLDYPHACGGHQPGRTSGGCTGDPHRHRAVGRTDPQDVRRHERSPARRVGRPGARNGPRDGGRANRRCGQRRRRAGPFDPAGHTDQLGQRHRCGRSRRAGGGALGARSACQQLHGLLAGPRPRGVPMSTR